MAGSKKPPEDDTPGQHMNSMIDCMETYTRVKIECFICGKRESDQDVTEAKFARWLYGEGWRNAISKKYQTIGPMCPKCVKTPDKKRV